LHCRVRASFRSGKKLLCSHHFRQTADLPFLLHPTQPGDLAESTTAAVGVPVASANVADAGHSAPHMCGCGAPVCAKAAQTGFRLCEGHFAEKQLWQHAESQTLIAMEVHKLHVRQERVFFVDHRECQASACPAPRGAYHPPHLLLRPLTAERDGRMLLIQVDGTARQYCCVREETRRLLRIAAHLNGQSAALVRVAVPPPAAPLPEYLTAAERTEVLVAAVGSAAKRILQQLLDPADPLQIGAHPFVVFMVGYREVSPAAPLLELTAHSWITPISTPTLCAAPATPILAPPPATGVTLPPAPRPQASVVAFAVSSPVTRSSS
jgi:hypothetical protein